jgi:hypothetical protein
MRFSACTRSELAYISVSTPIYVYSSHFLHAPKTHLFLSLTYTSINNQSYLRIKHQATLTDTLCTGSNLHLTLKNWKRTYILELIAQDYFDQLFCKVLGHLRRCSCCCEEAWPPWPWSRYMNKAWSSSPRWSYAPDASLPLLHGCASEKNKLTAR